MRSEKYPPGLDNLPKIESMRARHDREYGDTVAERRIREDKAKLHGRNRGVRDPEGDRSRIVEQLDEN